MESPELVNADIVGMPRAKSQDMSAFSFAFSIRMLYSCLVDADYLDTERVMNVEKFMNRPTPVSMDLLFKRPRKETGSAI